MSSCMFLCFDFINTNTRSQQVLKRSKTYIPVQHKPQSKENCDEWKEQRTFGECSCKSLSSSPLSKRSRFNSSASRIKCTRKSSSPVDTGLSSSLAVISQSYRLASFYNENSRNLSTKSPLLGTETTKYRQKRLSFKQREEDCEKILKTLKVNEL